MRSATPEYLYAFIVIALLAIFMWNVARRKKRLLRPLPTSRCSPD